MRDGHPVLDPARISAVRATGLLDTEPDEAFDGLARTAAAVLGAPFAFVTLVDDRRSFWKSCIGVAVTGPADRENTVEQSFCQYVIDSSGPVIIDDALLDPLTATNPSIASMGVRAWAGFPLRGPGGHVLGSFCVVDTVPRRWTDADVEVLGVLADAAGREIELRNAAATAQLAVAERDRANAKLRVLADVTHALHGTLDPELAVSRLAELVVPVLGEWSVVSLVGTDGELRDVGWSHVDELARPLVASFAQERLVDLAGRGSTHQAWRTNESVLVESDALATGLATIRSEQARDAWVRLRPGSYAAFPLMTADEVMGVLVVVRDEGQPPMSGDDLAIARDIAQRAALALQNGQLFARQRGAGERLHQANTKLRAALRHDRVVSRALQDAMLTRLPEPDHLHLVARYRTADEADQVGGDWYDALLTTDGAATLIIGDVAGHNISAATVMGQLRNLLRAFAWNDAAEPPSGLISRLDRAMHDLGIRTMATLSVFRVEQTSSDESRRQRTVRWSSAGHPPPVLLDVEGHADLLDAPPDPPIGIGYPGARHDHTREVDAGATLLLYTDGLVETRSLDFVGRERELLHSVVKHSDETLDDFVDNVLTDMVGRHPADDVAVMVVRFHPEDGPRPVEAGPQDASNHS